MNNKQAYKRPQDTYIRKRKINKSKQQFERSQDTYVRRNNIQISPGEIKQHDMKDDTDEIQELMDEEVRYDMKDDLSYYPDYEFASTNEIRELMDEEEYNEDNEEYSEDDEECNSDDDEMYEDYFSDENDFVDDLNSSNKFEFKNTTTMMMFVWVTKHMIGNKH